MPSGLYRSITKNKTYYPMTCLCCGVSFLGVDKHRKYCSSSCSAKITLTDRRETNLARYGVIEPLMLKSFQDKSKQTRLDRYGDPNYVNPIKGIQTKIETGSLDESIKKMHQTKLERYGDPNYVNAEKMYRTKKERHGDECYNNADQIKKTTQENYGVDNIFKTDQIKKLNKQREVGNRINKLNQIEPLFSSEGYTLLTSNEWLEKGGPIKARCPNNHEQYFYLSNWYKGCRCGKCFGNVSGVEEEVYEFLLTLTNDIWCNKRTIVPPYELDFYLPSHNIAIEFNGIYWHSIERGKDEKYHLRKTDMCKERGITLIHIFENEWEENRDDVKQYITSMINKNVLCEFDMLDIPHEIQEDAVIVYDYFGKAASHINSINGYFSQPNIFLVVDKRYPVNINNTVSEVEPPTLHFIPTRKGSMNGYNVWDCGRETYKIKEE